MLGRPKHGVVGIRGESLGVREVMSHDAASVTLMEDPSKRLGEVVAAEDGARTKTHDDVTSFLPILEGKPLDVNVSGALSRNPSIDNLDGGFVVPVKGSGALLLKTKFLHDGSKVFGMLGSGDSSHEFSLCRACGCH